MASKLVGISDKGRRILNNAAAAGKLIRTYVDESRKADKGHDFQFSLNGNNTIAEHKNIRVIRVTSLLKPRIK